MGLAQSPVVATAPGATLASLGLYEPGRRARVLVVDDDPRVRAAIVQTIALEEDLEVVAEAADATAALAIAERAGPSVALVDVLLPDGATGLALVASLAQRPGCAVVAMSMQGSLRPPAIAAGAVAFVEKGGDIDAVLEAVRAALVAPELSRRGRVHGPPSAIDQPRSNAATQ